MNFPSGVFRLAMEVGGDDRNDTVNSRFEEQVVSRFEAFQGGNFYFQGAVLHNVTMSVWCESTQV